MKQHTPYKGLGALSSSPIEIKTAADRRRRQTIKTAADRRRRQTNNYGRPVPTREIDANDVDVAVVHHNPRVSRGPLPRTEQSKRLTPREIEVAAGVCASLSNKEIGYRLNIAKNTVGTYIFHIFKKLGVSNRVGLVNAMRDAKPNTEVKISVNPS